MLADEHKFLELVADSRNPIVRVCHSPRRNTAHA